jgi:peptidoglycan/LPS O-acetylase OafA/YrhL
MTGAAAQEPAGHGGAAYRADIDGLRAVAVIAVILYHGGIPGMAGGFVGVDVFFVISGYLISSIIFRQLDQGRFSLAGFYERRVRRIAPALGVVLLACSGVAVAMLLPPDLLRFCKSLVATLLFGSNLYFWQTSGYFDTAAATKPLLHTWSLAIEEQFYLVFPLASLVVARYWARGRSRFFLCVLLVSLAACVIVTRRSTDAAFYMPVTRGWELLIGVMLSCWGMPAIRSRALRAALSASGLAAIVAAVFLFTPATPFPGAAALLPTLGTALVIAANRADDPLAGRLLTLPPVVLTGKMSYSLYLWHWPVFVFFRQIAGREPRPLELAALIILIFAVSAASWKFVEEPARRLRGGIPYGTLLRGLVAVAVILTLVGAGGWASDGFAFLQRPEVNRYLAGVRDGNPARARCFSPGIELLERGDPCRLGPDAGERPTFVVWGDSHANALMPVFAALADEQHVGGIFTGASGCIPLLAVRRIDRRDDCARLGDSVVALVGRRRLRDVILVAYWSVYTDGWEIAPPPPQPLIASATPGDTSSPHTVFARALAHTIDALKAQGARVWIVEQVPTQPREVPAWLATVAKRGGDPTILGRTAAEHRARQRFVAGTFRDLADGRTVRLIDPAEMLCASGRCLTSRDGRSLYIDYRHLSTFGAMQLQDFLRPMFRDIAADRY